MNSRVNAAAAAMQRICCGSGCGAGGLDLHTRRRGLDRNPAAFIPAMIRFSSSIIVAVLDIVDADRTPSTARSVE
jgi:hypothetical protein